MSTRFPINPTVLACALGPAIALGLALTYVVAPEFYLEHVLSRRDRENQIVEYVTFGSAALAAILLIIAAWRIWRVPQPRFRLGALAVAAVALATIFFAGEEISWGQTYLKWRTPENYRQYAVETNLHNTDIPVHTAANAFLVSLFFIAPLAWRWRSDLRLPNSLAPSIPNAPEIVCAATAFIWRKLKFIDPLLDNNQPAGDAPGGSAPAADAAMVTGAQKYGPFFDQINEHKELLIAIALLLYAINRFGAAKRG